MLGIRGHTDVWKSKAERGAAREEYLMGQLWRLAEQLQCEFPRAAAHFSDAPVGLSSYFAVVAGANLFPREEKECVAVWINCLTHKDMEAGGFLWMDRDRAMVLATVQDRVHQVSRVLRQVKTSLASILHVMFPLDEAPSTLWGQLAKFRDVHHVRERMWHELVAGVKAALSLVRLHRPDVDLAAVAAGPPLWPDGGMWDMRPHYADVRQYAKKIVDLFDQRAQVILQNR